MTYHDKSLSQKFTAKLIKGGKLVIPAALRHELGFKDGDTIIFERDGQQLLIKSYSQVIREVQKKVRQAITRPFTVDDYLAEKYAEAESE